jgi:hypothetical protein
MDDLAFMDSLQKIHTKQVGWMPTAQFEGKIKLGHVLVAEATKDEGGRMKDEDGAASGLSSSFIPHPSSLERVGYCIGNDQYFKRDDVGIIYQLNVAPGRQRGLIGATLIKAMFDRAAYGCKLFCCWCAQDIEANQFWEAIGFVPLAFRAGSRDKGRVHIFWQKRIRAGDTTTPWWFPSQTTSGSIREDRLVFPIPPGMHWSDEMPRVLPSEAKDEVRRMKDESKQRSSRKSSSSLSPHPSSLPSLGRLSFAPPVAAKKEKPKREPRQKVKNDPKLVAAARVLRDRWLERVNSGEQLALESRGKYEVSRSVGAVEQKRQLGAASGRVALLPAA